MCTRTLILQNSTTVRYARGIVQLVKSCNNRKTFYGEGNDDSIQFDSFTVALHS